MVHSLQSRHHHKESQASEWLLVSTGQSQWFLSCALLRRLLPSPKIQEIPGGSKYTGLVEIRNQIYLAAALSLLLEEPPVETTHRWGLLIRTEPESILLLVEEITGPITLSPEDICRRDDDAARFGAFVGTATYQQEVHPLLDPLQLSLLQPPPRRESLLPLAILKPSTIAAPAPPARTISLLVLEDGDQLYAFPAEACFQVRRIRRYRSQQQLLRPSQLLPPQHQGKLPHTPNAASFTCRLATSGGVMVLAFECFVELLQLEPSALSQWTGYTHYSLLGACLYGPQQALLLIVNPEALFSQLPGQLGAGKLPLASTLAESDIAMPSPTLHFVLFSIGEQLVALPLDQLHIVTSQRRATIHPISAKHPAIIGLQERAGEFLTLVDPALWLGFAATPSHKGNRLLELRIKERAIAILSPSLHAPIEVSTEQIKARPKVADATFPLALFPTCLSQGTHKDVPILDLETLLTTLLGEQDA